MARSVLFVLIVTAFALAVLVGGFLAVPFAIGRDDRDPRSIRYDAPAHSVQTVRHLVGISASRWE